MAYNHYQNAPQQAMQHARPPMPNMPFQSQQPQQPALNFAGADYGNAGMSGIDPSAFNPSTFSNSYVTQPQMMNTSMTSHLPTQIMPVNSPAGGLAISPQQFQNLGSISPGVPFMYQQQQSSKPYQMQQTPQHQQQLQQQLQQHLQQSQQATTPMNLVKQSPSQSPAMSSHANGSPMLMNSTQNRAQSEYIASSPHSASPHQQHFLGQSPQMTRVIPSHTNSSYMQHSMNMQDGMGQPMQSMGMDNVSSPTNYRMPQEKAFVNIPNRTRQNSPSSHIKSTTPGSSTSTPVQQHKQLEAATASTPRANDQSPIVRSRQETQSPRPSPRDEQSHSPAAVSAKDGAHTYVPKTWHMDTYGGVNLKSFDKYFDKFVMEPTIAVRGELGVVHVRALIMSLKSGMKMEMTNALNILSQIPDMLILKNCDDLLDVLLDILEQDFFGKMSSYPPTNGHSKTQNVTSKSRELSYATLFDMSLDEMKSLIPALENSTSELWLSQRERCLCIINLLHNLSFIHYNIDFFVKHDRFVSLLYRILDHTHGIDSTTTENTDRRATSYIDFRCMDKLEHRKSILTIFANIAVKPVAKLAVDQTGRPAEFTYLKLRNVEHAKSFVELIREFLSEGPGTTYALLAAEAWAKATIGSENRKMLSQLIISGTEQGRDEFCLLEDIWTELATMIQRDFLTRTNTDKHQLAVLTVSIMGMSSIIAVADTNEYKDRLILCNKSVPKTILRQCITWAASGAQQAHFQDITQRSLEFLRELFCTEEGTDQQQEPNHYSGNKKEKIKIHVSTLASRVLDMHASRELLLQAMTGPNANARQLSELFSLVRLIEDARALDLECINTV